MSESVTSITTLLIAGAGGGFISALITAIVSTANGWRQRATERKLKTRELALTLALEEWKVHIDQANRRGQGDSVYSPDTFVFRYNQILDRMESNTLTVDALKTIHRETMDYWANNQAAFTESRRERQGSTE